MTNRPRAITLILSTSLGLAACGGGTNQLSAADYRAKLAAISRQENANHAHVDNLPHEKSAAAMRADLTAFAAGDRRMSNEVAALKPPKNATQANALLARGARDEASETAALAVKLKTAKTVQGALKIIASAGAQTRGGKELDSALAQLKKLGYAHES